VSALAAFSLLCTSAPSLVCAPATFLLSATLASTGESDEERGRNGKERGIEQKTRALALTVPAAAAVVLLSPAAAMASMEELVAAEMGIDLDANAPILPPGE
jgi:hypothetical protein